MHKTRFQRGPVDDPAIRRPSPRRTRQTSSNPIERILLLAALGVGAFGARVPARRGELAAVVCAGTAAGAAVDSGSGTPTGAATPPGMCWIPGGEFTMGSDAPDVPRVERPAHRVRVDGFWMDETDVTNAQFRAFVEATGYVTTAEKTPTLEEIVQQSPPGTPPPRKEDLVAGSLVFTPPDHPVAAGRRERSGGSGRPAPTGATPKGRAVPSTARTITPSSTSPGSTPSPTRNGPASGCRPRPSGSARPAAAWKARSTSGATSRSTKTIRSATTSRATSRITIRRKTVTRARRR